MSPYPTVVMVTTAHQNASGIDLKKDISAPASAKYTADENRTTPVTIRSRNMKIVIVIRVYNKSYLKCFLLIIFILFSISLFLRKIFV